MDKNVDFTHYVLMWSYGYHHEPIETNTECFHRVIHSLKQEFDVSTSVSTRSIDSMSGDSSVTIHEVTFTIVNYHGDTEIVGVITTPNGFT